MTKHVDPTLTPTLRVLDEFARRYPDIAMPQQFFTFVAGQEQNNHQLSRLGSGELLFDFLRREANEPSRLHSFLREDSRLAQRIDYHALLQLDEDHIFTFLVDRLAHVFDYQQNALDSERATGFNSHGYEHVCNVTRAALLLLRELNPLPTLDSCEKEVVIGGLLHDIGNLLQRCYHGLYGLYFATQLFENYATDEATFDSFLQMLEVIVFHEVEFGSQNALFERLNPATLAVIVGDKTDVSFRRVSAKSNVEEAMQDAHVLVNLLVANSSIHREVGHKGRFAWTVDFRAKFNGGESDLFSRLLKATGRVKYPKAWTTLYEESNIEYLFVFQSTFLRIYLSRLYFVIRAVFTLYPSISEFHLIVDDAERDISLTRVFHRHEYRQQIARLGKLFYRNQWPQMYLYNALH